MCCHSRALKPRTVTIVITANKAEISANIQLLTMKLTPRDVIPCKRTVIVYSRKTTPITPPSRVARGQLEGIGNTLRLKEVSNSARKRSPSLTIKKVGGRLRIVCAPQIKSTSEGNKLANPIDCNNKSAKRAPPDPRRFFGSVIPALFKDGSLGV